MSRPAKPATTNAGPRANQREEAAFLSHMPPVLDAATWQQVVRTVGLSEKQAQVVALMMRGLGDKQIGRSLDIQYGTVRMHRERAVERLGLDGANRAEVTSRVFELAWEALIREPCPHCRRSR